MIVCRSQLINKVKQVRNITNSFISANKKNDKDDKEVNKKLGQEDAANKLNKLLNLMIQEDQKPKKDVKLIQAVKKRKDKAEKEKTLGEKLESAAKDVAKNIEGEPGKTEEELLNILLKRPNTEPQLLKDVLSGITVEKSVPQPSESRAQVVRDTLTRQGAGGPEYYQGLMKKTRPKLVKDFVEVDIMKAQPSTYFGGIKLQPAPCELATWDSCVKRDLRLAVTQPPSNIYEQMIQWTDQGMLWKFPIDNEQGLEEEKKVTFDEHVFLDVHLEGWCPPKGPIRHFMELVCVGLSKNHWLSADEKRAHIYWYRDYFADKKELIKEVGAGDIQFEPDKQKQLSQ